MTKDCNECEGVGHVAEHCGNCGGLGERYPSVHCRPCKGEGEIKHKCEALGCNEGQVEVEHE